jgi:hypothetical protein
LELGRDEKFQWHPKHRAAIIIPKVDACSNQVFQAKQNALLVF